MNLPVGATAWLIKKVLFIPIMHSGLDKKIENEVETMF